MSNLKMKNLFYFIIFLNLVLLVQTRFRSFIIDRLDEITKENKLNLQEECLSQMKVWLKSIESNSSWSLNVIDSFGQVPSGFLAGNIVWPGEYSQCLSINNQNWSSKYCYINQKLKWTNTLNRNDTLRFKYGMCFPKKCNDIDLTKIFQNAIDKLDDNVLPFDKSYLAKSDVYCREGPKIDAYLVIAIIVTGLIVIIVLVSTVLEVYFIYIKSKESQPELKETENKKRESILVKILLCFSAYKNTLKIFSGDEKSKSQFSCLHSIRFFGFLWVVVLHQWNHYTEIDDLMLSNYFEYYDWKKSFLFTIISNGYFCVDIFFLISGLLCSYTFLRHTSGKKINGLTVIKFYLRRYYRITVTLMLVMLFIVGFNRFFHPGPFRSEFYYWSENRCPTFFWTNLLHINNMYNKLCFPHSWYLATDMQFYLIAPIVLIPLTFKNKIRLLGYGLIFSIIIIHIVTTAVFTAHFLEPISKLKYRDVMGLYYLLEFRPWCRVAPFAFGLLLGKIFTDLPREKFIFSKNKTKNLIIIVASWVVSLSLLSVTIFSQYSTFSGIDPMSRTGQTVYVTLSRITFSLGLSGVIFLCITQNGGFINQFLSWSFWLPLAKLSYCAYLVHYSIVDSFVYAQEHFVYMQPSLFFYVYCGNVFMTTCLAYVANLLFESPFMNLENFIFRI